SKWDRGRRASADRDGPNPFASPLLPAAVADRCPSLASAYSSTTSIANSGQLACASHALSSSPRATTQSPTALALPYSLSAKSSGASALHRLCPWQRSPLTRTRSRFVSLMTVLTG